MTGPAPSPPTSAANPSSTDLTRPPTPLRRHRSDPQPLRDGLEVAAAGAGGQHLPAGWPRASGSKASRRRACASRSSGPNSSGMKSRFSSPMPCSPDSTPPAASDTRDDLLAGRVHPLEHARLAGVEQQQRVEVAVAGVEDVHHDQVVALGDRVDLGEHVDQPPAGHDGVVQVVVRPDAGDGAERRLAALPPARPARPRPRPPAPSGAVGAADLARSGRGPPPPPPAGRRPRPAARPPRRSGSRRGRSPRPPG